MYLQVSFHVVSDSFIKIFFGSFLHIGRNSNKFNDIGQNINKVMKPNMVLVKTIKMYQRKKHKLIVQIPVVLH